MGNNEIVYCDDCPLFKGPNVTCGHRPELYRPALKSPGRRPAGTKTKRPKNCKVDERS